MQTIRIHQGLKVWDLAKAKFKKAAHFERRKVVCRLRQDQKIQIQSHLLSLSQQDRYLRFGYHAQDDQIQRYVEHIDFSRDKILGVFDLDLSLVAMAHLSLSRPSRFNRCAEFGVSVLPKWRAQGLGAQLFEHSSMLARNEGVGMLFIHALSENLPMLKIARAHGAKLERFGGETDAFLQLSTRNWASRLHQWCLTFYAQTDLDIKMQVQQSWHLLSQIQEIRQGVRDGRQIASLWNTNVLKIKNPRASDKTVHH
jgi:GNAT superfamily N-acetyltransferase